MNELNFLRMTHDLDHPTQETKKDTGSSSTGSVRERALRMEAADEEAKRLNAKPALTFVDKLKKIFSKSGTDKSGFKVEEKLSDEVINRVLHGTLFEIRRLDDYQKLQQIAAHPRDYLKKEDLQKLSIKNQEKAIDKVIRTAELRQRIIKYRLETNFTDQINDASSLDSLGLVMGIRGEALLSEDTHWDQSLALYVKKIAKPYNMHEITISTIVVDLAQVVSKRVKEISQGN